MPIARYKPQINPGQMPSAPQQNVGEMTAPYRAQQQMGQAIAGVGGEMLDISTKKIEQQNKIKGIGLSTEFSGISKQTLSNLMSDPANQGLGAQDFTTKVRAAQEKDWADFSTRYNLDKAPGPVREFLGLQLIATRDKDLDLAVDYERKQIAAGNISVMKDKVDSSLKDIYLSPTNEDNIIAQRILTSEAMNASMSPEDAVLAMSEYDSSIIAAQVSGLADTGNIPLASAKLKEKKALLDPAKYEALEEKLSRSALITELTGIERWAESGKDPSKYKINTYNGILDDNNIKDIKDKGDLRKRQIDTQKREEDNRTQFDNYERLMDDFNNNRLASKAVKKAYISPGQALHLNNLLESKAEGGPGGRGKTDAAVWKKLYGGIYDDAVNGPTITQKDIDDSINSLTPSVYMDLTNALRSKSDKKNGTGTPNARDLAISDGLTKIRQAMGNEPAEAQKYLWTSDEEWKAQIAVEKAGRDELYAKVTQYLNVQPTGNISKFIDEVAVPAINNHKVKTAIDTMDSYMKSRLGAAVVPRAQKVLQSTTPAGKEEEKSYPIKVGTQMPFLPDPKQLPVGTVIKTAKGRKKNTGTKWIEIK
jgi:hypothetical protein